MVHEQFGSQVFISLYVNCVAVFFPCEECVLITKTYYQKNSQYPRFFFEVYSKIRFILTNWKYLSSWNKELRIRLSWLTDGSEASFRELFNMSQACKLAGANILSMFHGFFVFLFFFFVFFL